MRTTLLVSALSALLLSACSSGLDETTAAQRDDNGAGNVPGVPVPEYPEDDHGEEGEPGGGGGGSTKCVDKVLDSKVPLILHATTTGMGDDFAGATKCDSTNGNDVAYLYRVPETGRYHINTLHGAFMAQISLRNSCDGPVIACSEEVPAGPFGTAMYVDLTKGQQLIIVIDGDTSVAGGDSGDFRLEITKVGTTETTCGDGLDDDGDGNVDCADTDCNGQFACVENGSNCLDGVDNDGDGKIDCADEGCQPSVDATLESKVPVTVSGTTAGKSNDYVIYGGGMCGQPDVNKTPDVGYSYTTPEDGFYRFIARAADGAILSLQLRTPECYSSTRTCNTPPIASGAGGLTMKAGETVIFVVEARSEAGEPFTLEVTKE